MRNLSYENEFCMQFHFHTNQSHFHKNGFALRLAVKQRHKGTRKWPIFVYEFMTLLSGNFRGGRYFWKFTVLWNIEWLSCSLIGCIFCGKAIKQLLCTSFRAHSAHWTSGTKPNSFPVPLRQHHTFDGRSITAN